jgi:hypothetical protein
LAKLISKTTQHISIAKERTGNMKEAIVAKGLQVSIQDVPIPEPQPDQVVIKVVVSGSNPKDWYVYDLFECILC